MQSLLILGRQPKLGTAELESLYGPDKIQPLGDNGCLLDIDWTKVNFNELGGSLKLAQVISVLDTTNWHQLSNELNKILGEQLSKLDESKVNLGISSYGLDVNPGQLLATGLSLKKYAKSINRSIRVIPNKNTYLSSAQAIHNKLAGSHGIEFILVKQEGRTIVATRRAVQDIEAYSTRDRQRPKRDARVGMLPPKLAQIIINLARANNSQNQQQKKLILLDPFCGSGVVLQEARLMGLDVLGSDIDERMIEFSKDNMAWLDNMIPPGQVRYELEIADATQHQWLHKFDIIACETFLGPPLSSLPPASQLKQIVQNCNNQVKLFLQNVANQTKNGFRMCVAVPAWKTKNDFLHLPVIASLDKLGYNRINLEHAQTNELIYHRPGQIVARELVTLERK